MWKKAVSLRKRLGVDSTSPVDVFSLSYSIPRLTIVYYPMGERLSGVCIKEESSNVIAINSAMTLGRQRFSMAHELYHLYYDGDPSTAICAKIIGVGDERENEADQFASYFLMPPDALAQMIESTKKKPSDELAVWNIVFLEQHFQVSRQALLHRLVDEGVLSLQKANTMKNNVRLSAINLGYDITLYEPTSVKKQYGTYGYYIKLADQIRERGLISSGKYEELLLLAFRSDLVFGDHIEGGEFLD